MAFCPKCSGVMDTAAVACPHCGYAFPPADPNPRDGLAYSPLANLALIVGILAAGLGCVVAVIGTIIALVTGQWGTALVVGPLAFFLQLAMLVVFMRVQRI